MRFRFSGDLLEREMEVSYSSVMAMDDLIYHKPLQIHLVTSTESSEFAYLVQTLSQTSIVGLDAEWKPFRLRSDSEKYGIPTVSLLQVACQLDSRLSSGGSVVFLLDLFLIDLPTIWEMLRDVFVSRDVLKLGFQFKKDLANLSHTFVSQGCESGFDRVEPYTDISSMYKYLQSSQLDSIPRETKGLAAICNEILGISISKELQCSDWSSRPLTENQKTYAAADVNCLLEIFSRFRAKVAQEGKSLDRPWRNILPMEESLLDIVRIFGEDMTVGRSIKLANTSKMIVGKSIKTPKVSKKAVKNFVKKPKTSKSKQKLESPVIINDNCDPSPLLTEESLSNIIRDFGGKLMVDESVKTPKVSKKAMEYIVKKPKTSEREQKLESPVIINDNCDPSPPLTEESLSNIVRDFGGKLMVDESVKTPDNPKSKGKLESSFMTADGQCPPSTEESLSRLVRNSSRNMIVPNTVKTPNTSIGKGKAESSEVIGERKGHREETSLELVRDLVVDTSVNTPKSSSGKEKIESPMGTGDGLDPQILEESLVKVVRKYCENVKIKESIETPKTNEWKKKKKKKKKESLVSDCQDPPPPHSSLGGDECLKVLCDVMFKGLAKYLRYVGIDAAIPPSKKRLIKDLFKQSRKEKRVLLTNDANLSGSTLACMVKNRVGDDQLLEIITTFKLKITRSKLMSRCLDCNGTLVKPLTGEQLVEAANGFQMTLPGKSWGFWHCMDCNHFCWEDKVKPRCFNCKGKSTKSVTPEEAVKAAKDMGRTLRKHLQFWQCMGCSQLHWEGNYQNVVQKLIDAGKFFDMS